VYACGTKKSHPLLGFYFTVAAQWQSVFKRDGYLLYVDLSVIDDYMLMVFMCMFALSAFRNVRMTSRRKVYIIGLYLEQHFI